MSDERFQFEAEAAIAFAELIEDARHVRQLYERAKNPLPDPLLRLLGLERNERDNPIPQRPSAKITSPYSRRPRGVAEDWINILAKEATPTSLIPAILGAA